jgi:hypothetical protein
MTAAAGGLPADGAQWLPPSRGDLGRGGRGGEAGAIIVASELGGLRWTPKPGRVIVFGRNFHDVHVCFAESDPGISRCQGTVTFRADQWWLAGTGRVPLRLPNSLWLHDGDEPIPLEPGYTPVVARGVCRSEHLLEIYVAAQDRTPSARHRDPTSDHAGWRLSPDEKLVLVALGQRYLLREPWPQPWTRTATAKLLAELEPHAGWTSRHVENLVKGVRYRLSRAGVTGLTRVEVGEPVGNMLNHNLMQELISSGTLVPRDLELLDR